VDFLPAQNWIILALLVLSLGYLNVISSDVQIQLTLSINYY